MTQLDASLIKWLQGYGEQVGQKRDEKAVVPQVSELGTAVKRRWYLGWSAFGPSWFVNVFNCSFTAESTEQGTISERAGVRRRSPRVQNP
jgi:hypothetical protein